MNNVEARALLRRTQEGDARARELLVESLTPMVRQLARRFADRGEPLDDLIQVGMVGLLRRSTGSTWTAESAFPPTPFRA